MGQLDVPRTHRSQPWRVGECSGSGRRGERTSGFPASAGKEGGTEEEELEVDEDADFGQSLTRLERSLPGREIPERAMARTAAGGHDLLRHCDSGLVAGCLGISPGRDMWEELFPPMDELDREFRLLEGPAAPVDPEVPIFGVAQAPETGPVEGTTEVAGAGRAGGTEWASTHSVGEQWPISRRWRPSHEDVGVQTGPEVREAAQQCEGMPIFPDELTLRGIMRVIRQNADTTVEEVVFRFLGERIAYGSWQAKAVEIAAAAGIAMLQQLGEDMRYLVARDQFEPSDHRLLNAVDQSMRWARTGLDEVEEGRAWAGLVIYLFIF